MPDRDRYPAGVPCWVDTAQPDPQAAAAFYGGLFGWELQDRMPPEAPGHYFEARLRGLPVAAIGSLPPGAPPEPHWSTYVRVESADGAAAAAEAAGGRVLAGPFDVFGAGRMAALADAEGAVISAWQPGRHQGAQVVNEPGAWVFSELNSRDREAAERFYGALFGWKAIDVGPGGGAMWTLPGYADFLEERDPGVQERHARAGAPAGFSDAVAWLVPLQDQGAPVHWSTTFAVDDADAAAARARDLGGRVLVPPFDAPWVRMAVLRDPQGAVFSVSRYSPGNAG